MQFSADAHCDFLYGMYRHQYDINSLRNGQTIYLPYMREGGIKLQFFAVWIDRELKTSYLQQCLGMIDAYYRMLDTNKDALMPFSSAYTPENPQIATILTLEGGEALEGSLAVLRVLKRLGVSAMTLTWNHHNELCGASMKKGGKGLTALGREVIQEMENLGIALDVSHLSDAGISDALAISKKPIFASHSNARHIYSSPRGLENEHIAEIARRGGVIGVNFYYKQLCAGNCASIKDIVRHILHIIKTGGIQCCCIGSDFDGMTQYPEDLKTSADIPALLAALRSEGLSDEEIQRIAYRNLHEYIYPFAPKLHEET